MIKIASTNMKKDDNSRIKSKKKSLPVKLREESFAIALQNRIKFNFQGDIDELLDELKEEEKHFLEKRSLYELNRYRSIVQKILRKILVEGLKTKSLTCPRRDNADFIIVQIVNSRLLDIAKEITKETNKGFNLLKAIEEIRGLILDLVY